jgi:hypothetical protein
MSLHTCPHAAVHDDYVTRKAFLILNTHVESVNYKFQPCLTSSYFFKLLLNSADAGIGC